MMSSDTVSRNDEKNTRNVNFDMTVYAKETLVYEVIPSREKIKVQRVISTLTNHYGEYDHKKGLRMNTGLDDVIKNSALF